MTFRINIAQATAFAMLVSFAPGVGAAPYQAEQTKPPATERAMGIRMKAKGVPNFGQVTPNLYRGGQPGPDGLQALKDVGVNLVVDLRGSASKDEEATATKLGMQYVSIPSHCPFPKDEVFAKFLRVLRENTGKNAFVHCRLGDDRTGMAVAAYRIAEEGWSAEEAMKEMKAFGFSTMHHAMCPGMADYEESFPQRLKTSRAFKELQPYGSNTTTK
jgi:tyrosine-protein phosphatase SIW14